MEARFSLRGVWTCLVVVLLLGCLPCQASKKSFQARKPKHHCQLPPKWSSMNATSPGEQQEPMAGYRGRGEVVVVALVSGDCAYCSSWLQSLATLASLYPIMGWRRLRFAVVNHPEANRRLRRPVKHGRKLDLYELDANSTMWKDIGGRSKDVFVYDVCGRLQYKLSHPYSKTKYYYLTAAIRNAFKFPKHACGTCKAPVPTTQPPKKTGPVEADVIEPAPTDPVPGPVG